MSIAEFVLKQPGIDRVWLVLSPHNPLKKKDSLQDAAQRLENLQKAVRRFNDDLRSAPEPSGEKIGICDIEFRLPEPHYTYRTLQALQEENPQTEFILIVGADNLASFDKWYKGDEILRKYTVWVYPRKGYPIEELCRQYGVRCLDAPLLDISSTLIREGEKEGKDMSGYRY